VSRSPSFAARVASTIADPLLAQDLERALHRRVVDLELRPLDLRCGNIADLHLGIDLEGGAELERRGIRRAVLLLDLRVACDLQIRLPSPPR
jgi:hypothetical protein